MKKTIKLIGIIALAAIIGLSFAACDDGGGGGGGSSNTATYTGTSGGQTYTLKITKSGSRYTAQNGDDYELSDGQKKSAGTVENVSGGVLTLKPSNAETPFTATVSGTASLASLVGTITWSDNTTAAAPGALTGGTNPGTGSGGTLTVTDIPAKYNGKYAAIIGGISSDTSISLYGFQSVGGAVGTEEMRNWTFSRVSNGRVSVPVWLENADKTLVRYSGNDTFLFGFGITEASTFGQYSTDVLLASGPFNSVTFTNGSTTVSLNDAFVWAEYK